MAIELKLDYSIDTFSYLYPAMIHNIGNKTRIVAMKKESDTTLSPQFGSLQVNKAIIGSDDPKATYGGILQAMSTQADLLRICQNLVVSEYSRDGILLRNTHNLDDITNIGTDEMEFRLGKIVLKEHAENGIFTKVLKDDVGECIKELALYQIQHCAN